MGLGSVRNAVIQQSQQPQSVGGKGVQQPQQSGSGEVNYGFEPMLQQNQPQRVGGKGIGQAVTNFQRQSQFPAPRDMYAGMPSPSSSFGFQQNPYAAPFNQYIGSYNQPSQQMSPYVSSYYMPQQQMYQQPMYQQPMYQQPQPMGGKGFMSSNPYFNPYAQQQPYFFKNGGEVK